ncbi:MAG: M12 family metallo-peptidase, partial [Saprospiraceae bacterium]
EPLKYYNQWADNDEVIVYQAKDVKKASAQRTCFRPNTERSTSTLSPDARSAGDCYKAKLAILADYAMYIDPAHSGVAAVVNHIVGVMNNVGLDFQYNGGVNFGDGISFELSELVIATCATCDPLSAQTNPTTLLSEFSSWIDKGGFAHPFHAAHLWTDRDLISTTVGVAFLSSNLYCRTMARAIFQDWSTNALMLRITISHEIGHNFNAAHDASNSGYIMAPTISSTSTTWSPDSKSMISGQIALQGPSCLSACSAQPCSSLTGLSLGAVTPTNFSLSWNASSAGSYLVKVRELGSNIDLINTNTNAANITLSPLGYDICKKYDVFVYNNCSASGLSEVQRLLVISPVSQGCADFSASSQAGWVGKTMSLTDQSINASSWFWNFGNGQTSSQKNSTIAYTNAGTYHISLTVNGNHTMTKASYINILPDMPTPFTTTQGGDFESNLNYFASATMDGGPNIWELGSSTYSLATQGNAWKTKLNTNVPQVTTKSALYSPRFNFSGYQFHTLSFDLSMQSLYCNAPIAVQLQYSTDDGSSWQRLGNAPSFYNAGSGGDCTIHSLVFDDGTGWSFNGSYLTKSMDISFLSGVPSVIFRFVLSISGVFSGGYNVDGILIDNFTISAAGGIVLQLNMESLTAKKSHDKNHVLLQWEVFHHQDISSMEVERSRDGISFGKIGQVEVSIDDDNYLFTDLDPEDGLNYYRIKSIDHDIRTSYTNIASISIGSAKSVRVFPNPLTIGQILHLETNENMDELKDMYFTNILGHNIPIRTEEVENKTIQTGHLPDGVYVLTIQWKDGRRWRNKLYVSK